MTTNSNIVNNSTKLNQIANSVESSCRDGPISSVPINSNIYRVTDENSSSVANDFNSSYDRRPIRAAPIKHYEVPNLTSMLYEYTNREKDLVERAFRGGNYQTLRSLPDDIRPHSVG